MKRGIMTYAETRTPSPSAVWLITHPKGNPYQNLANAIIATAADDYRLALKNRNEKLKMSLESFFHSDWYRFLTNVNGDKLIWMLKNERLLSKRAKKEVKCNAS